MSRLRIVIVFVAFAFTAVESQAPARRNLPKSADTVQVWSDAASLRGRLGVVRRVAADTLLIGLRTTESPRVFLDTPISTASVTRIDVMTGRGPSGKRTFAATLGAAVFSGLLGATIGRLASDPDEGSERATQTAFGGLGGFAIGGVIGAYLGSQPVAKWVRVY
jgi:hypothetical protein